MTITITGYPSPGVADVGADARPVSRCAACPTSGGAGISVETADGPRPIPPPPMLSAVERAVLRNRYNDLQREAAWFESVEGVLDMLLLDRIPWADAVYATRSVGAFRLPMTVSLPWRPERQLEVHELQAWSFADVQDVQVLNLLVMADRVSEMHVVPSAVTLREQLQIVLAPSGLIEQVERGELEAAALAGDAAFDEIERG